MDMKESLWLNEFARRDFVFQGRDAIVVLPEGKANGRWLLKTEYFGAFPHFETEMLRRGYHLAYLKNKTRWGLDEDADAKREFAVLLQERFGLADKCVPVGMSCGGLLAVKLAARHPEMISALYLDAPVINLLSCPFNLAGSHKDDERMKQEALRHLGLTMQEMISYREHPLDKLPELVHARIPVVMVYGAVDETVPYEENGALLERVYRQAGIEIETYRKDDCGHHPHGLDDAQPIIEFVLRHDAGAMLKTLN